LSTARTAAVPGWLPAISAIARNTFREAVRDRVLYLMLAFALLMILASRFLAMLTVGSETKIIKDLGLSAISVFGLLTAVFVGVSLVFKEIDKRTIYTMLATPVRRWQFVTGKYAGLLSVLTLNAVVMFAVLTVVLWTYGESPAPLVPAVALILVELSIVAAIAILLSSYTNPMLAALGTVAAYVAGHLSWSFELLARRIPEGSGRGLVRVLSWLVPNLDRLDLKALAVHGVPIPAGQVGYAVLYGLGYAIAVLVLACVVFERREFRA